MDRDVEVPVSVDVGPCDACLAELADPADRRFRYPFINCTDCGPRYTITRRVPYDRPVTTMAGFAMCPTCRAEYEDPADRRFHAQPVCCPACGPQVELTLRGTPFVRGDDALTGAVAPAPRPGRHPGGEGGRWLPPRRRCDRRRCRRRAAPAQGTRRQAVRVARRRRRRRAALVDLDEVAAQELTSPRRPIVLAPRRADAPWRVVAPGLPELGVMLPPSPSTTSS
jgi:hydrogenase maturation protein HypF